AGLDAKVADELGLGGRPSAMNDDEAAVYEFCIQLHRTRKVDEASERAGRNRPVEPQGGKDAERAIAS
ncbi:MAG: hypothetical protein WAN75_38575, partial [Xanthobacteraceae bacterium]